MAMSNLNGGSNMETGSIDDVWDDRELIKAYDKAVKSWRKSQSDKEKVGTEATAGPGPWTEVSKEKDQQLAVKVAAPFTQQGLLSPSMLEIGSWIVGAPCRALYSQDGLEYEAKIVGMEGPQCTVRFVGYGNEELVHLTALKTTHGKKSRDKQRREAQLYNNQTNQSSNSVDVDCQSNISLTSSMYNNYTDSVCRDRDVEETFTDSVVPTPLQSSTPQNAARRPARERNMRNQVFASYKLRTANFNDPAEMVESVDNVDSAIPSAAEATIDSSSDRSSNAEGQEPQEGLGNGNSGQWEGFNNAMPQLKFPVPPMPLSLSNNNGSFDFGRGEIPALLMSWYMAGYQAGCFDAKREIANSANGSGSRVPKSTKHVN